MVDSKGKGTWEQGVRARLVEAHCVALLRPLLRVLDQQLDRRLVQTALGLVLALLIHRHRQQGLVLSELGGYLLSPARAMAGTKRIRRLLQAPGWSAAQIEQFLLVQADARLAELGAAGELPLVIWDESVWEKPESIALEGLGPARSARAARLKRIRPGYYHPPGGPPVFVPGLNWLQVLVAGRTGLAQVAQTRWWTTRGERASDKRSQEGTLLAELAARWGRAVLHIWDRGFAGQPWLQAAVAAQVRFVLRWPKRYHLRHVAGQEGCAWELCRGKRAQDQQLVWDARRRVSRRTGVLTLPVHHPACPQALWLVVARPGQGREPWYLLTNEPIETVADAWRVVHAYARRWQVEMSLRFHKSELALESARVFGWDARAKLLGLVSLAYACLLSLLRPERQPLAQWLLAHFCPRTEKRHHPEVAPLYRLRAALSRLWLAQPPPFLLSLSSG